jgi:hypothetical protein
MNEDTTPRTVAGGDQGSDLEAARGAGTMLNPAPPPAGAAGAGGTNALIVEALDELRRARVHMLRVDAVGEVLRALVRGAHLGVEVLVERAVARAHELEPWRGLQLLGLEADASRFAPGCAPVLRSQLRELSEMAEAAARAQRTPAPPPDGAPLDEAGTPGLADLDRDEPARADALATAQGAPTRPAVVAPLSTIGSRVSVANDVAALPTGAP